MEKLGLLAAFVQSVLALMPSGDIFNDHMWRLLCAQALFNLVNNRVCGEGPSRTIFTLKSSQALSSRPQSNWRGRQPHSRRAHSHCLGAR